MCKIILSLLLFIYLGNVSSENYPPIVLWHGLRDSCCHPNSLGYIIRELEKALPGVYVSSLKIGDNTMEEKLNSVFMHPDKQIELACNIVKSDPLLADGYNAIGFSQGSQFMRGLAQRCPEPKMKNFATLGGQHQGVYGIPKCRICDLFNPILTKIAYNSAVQEHLAPAAYWHEAVNKTAYLNGNTFIADINNEISINQTYIDNLQALENFILIKFEDDRSVKPKDSQWFEFYKDGQTKEIEPLSKSKVYERLGLRKMDLEGKLHFFSTPGDHGEIDMPWFMENIIYKFFK